MASPHGSNHNVNGLDVEEISIPVAWGHVSGKWWGPRGQQPILAIHGWQDNAASFDPLVPLLPKSNSVLCIDFPGHGRSSHYPPGMNYFKFWDGVTLIRKIVKHYSWSKVSLLGHSFGGTISFLYAATYPEDVERIICLDVAGPRIYHGIDIIALIGQSIDTFLKYQNISGKFIPNHNYNEMIDIAYMGHNDSVTREKCKVLMERGMAPAEKPNCYTFTRDVRLRSANLGMMTEEQIFEYAARIKCKVLNIRAIPGMNGSNILEYLKVVDKVRETAELLEYYEVEGTHHVHLNEPEKVANYISNFLLS